MLFIQSVQRMQSVPSVPSVQRMQSVPCIPFIPHIQCIAITLLLCACASPAAETAAVKNPPSPAAVADPPTPSTAIAPANTIVRASTAWDEGGAPGLRIRTEHYNLYLALKDPIFRGWMPTYIKACNRAYATVLGALPMPKDALDLYIFASREPWEAWTRKTLGKGAGVYLNLGRGGFTSDGVSVLYDIGRSDTLTIAAHEGWHQFSQSSLKQPLPIWMEEGLACWMEGTRITKDGEPTAFRPWRNFERWNELRGAVQDDRVLTLGELLETSPQQCLEKNKETLLSYYAQCWALIHFLNEGEGGKYQKGMKQLLQDAAEGKLAAKLLSSRAIPNPTLRQRAARSRVGNFVALEYFNADFAAFESEYNRFLGLITKRGAGDRIYRGENPLLEKAPTAATKPPASKPQSK